MGNVTEAISKESLERAQRELSMLAGLGEIAMRHEQDAKKVYKRIFSLAEGEAGFLRDLFTAPEGSKIKISGHQFNTLMMQQVLSDGNIVPVQGDERRKFLFSDRVGPVFLGDSLKMDSRDNSMWVYDMDAGNEAVVRVEFNSDCALGLEDERRLSRERFF